MCFNEVIIIFVLKWTENYAQLSFPQDDLTVSLPS